MPLSLTIYNYDVIAEGKRKSQELKEMAEKIRKEVQANPVIPQERKVAVDKLARVAKDAYEQAENIYRFWRFMQNHGCQCCTLRFDVELFVTRADWQTAFDKLGALSTALQALITVGEFFSAKPVPIGDPTGATTLYQLAVNAMVDGGILREYLNQAIKYGNIGNEGCVKLPMGASGRLWQDAVDQNGEPLK